MDEQPEQEYDTVPEDLVQDMLKNLADITRQTHENEVFKHAIVGQLKNIGYEYFPENEGKPCAEHVVKILKVAINNTMTSEPDLKQDTDEHNDEDDDDESDKTNETLGKKLAGLLEINDGKCVEDYFSKGCFALRFYIMPLPHVSIHTLPFSNKLPPSQGA